MEFESHSTNYKTDTQDTRRWDNRVKINGLGPNIGWSLQWICLNLILRCLSSALQVIDGVFLVLFQL